MEYLANECLEKAQVLEKRLARYGIHTVVPVTSGIVPISLGCKEEAEFVQQKLEEENVSTALLNVGKETFGIRIVITPDLFYDEETLERLAQGICIARSAFQGEEKVQP